MTAVIGDLHGAGSETTSTTLTWALLYLMKHPDVQKKLQGEIDRVVGKSRMPSLADKSEMPYTEAVMLEVLRYSSIVSIGVFHEAMEDTTFHGYFIPKGTQIVGNLHGAHFNPETWGDPQNFRPERFLTPDGKKIVEANVSVWVKLWREMNSSFSLPVFSKDSKLTLTQNIQRPLKPIVQLFQLQDRTQV